LKNYKIQSEELAMFNYNKNYYNIMPKITIYSNCDTALTLNLGCFSFAPEEQLIFIIKNHDYTDAPVEFLHTILPKDLNSDKNVSLFVPKENAAEIKTGAIYTFMIKHKDGQYSKLTPNGTIRVEYGAHDVESPVLKEENTDE
jgi:hypothetical protein